MKARRGAAPRLNARERRDAKRQAEIRRREQARRLRQAAADWKRLGAAGQFGLVSEIVETRGEELNRAYAGVVGVAAGHSRYQRPGARHKSVWREAAVTFFVRRKWRPGSAAKAGAIPQRLLAYATVGGRRVLCAVPTDVEDVRDYRLSAQAARGVVVTPPAAMPALEPSLGAITCVVRTSAASSTLYALSCRHVIGLAKALPPDYPLDAGVFRESDEEPIDPLVASASDIYGLLRGGTDDNFDVALARLRLPIVDPAVQEVVVPLGPSSFLDSHAAIEQLGTYTILTPTGPKAAKYVRGLASSQQIPVDYGALGSLRQRVLVVESELTSQATAGGDSGSPVVTRDRSRLVGMHFAGSGRTSYMIPAYELVRRRNYVGFGNGAPFVFE